MDEKYSWKDAYGENMECAFEECVKELGREPSEEEIEDMYEALCHQWDEYWDEI